MIDRNSLWNLLGVPVIVGSLLTFGFLYSHKVKADIVEIDENIVYGFICKVVKIKDGDTFKCADGTSIRIWGVDTPELKSKVLKEKEKALLAKEALVKIIEENGGYVYCVSKGASFNRVVSKCYLMNDLGAKLIKEGYAKEVKQYSKGHYSTIINLNSVKSGKINE